MAEEDTAQAEVKKAELAGGGLLADDVRHASQRLDGNKAGRDEIGEEEREMLTTFEERGGHKRALRDVTRIKRMEVEKRTDYLRAFDSYRNILGLDDQPDMFDAADDHDADDDHPADPADPLEIPAALDRRPGAPTEMDGRQAYKDGKAVTDNPHPAGSPAFDLWERGWRAAAAETDDAADAEIIDHPAAA